MWVWIGMGTQVHSGCLLARWEGHFKAVTALRLSSDGCLLVSCAEDSLIHVWDVTRFVFFLSAHSGGDMGSATRAPFLWHVCASILSHAFTQNKCSLAHGIWSILSAHSVVSSAVDAVDGTSVGKGHGSAAPSFSPLHSFGDHSLPVTDVFLAQGTLGRTTLMLSVSKDRTCKVSALPYAHGMDGREGVPSRRNS